MKIMDTTEKIYKELAEIRGRMLTGILHKAYLATEYQKEKPEDLYKTVSFISDKSKWDYCGISSKEDLIKLELLEKLLYEK